MNTISKGQIALLKVELKAAEKGLTVCKPTSEGTRYDLIIDTPKGLKRVQVKYCDTLATSTEQLYEINLRKKNNNRGPYKTYSNSDIDALIVYLPSVDKLCWLDIGTIKGKQSITLRTAKNKNRCSSSRMADDFIW